MTGRYIIIVERDDDCLVPIVSTGDEGACAIFPTEDDAETLASEHALCRAYSYRIIDFDEA